MNQNTHHITFSDLQNNIDDCFRDLDEVGKKIIVSGNVPKAVILSLDEFEFMERNQRFPAVEPDEWEREAIKKHEERRANGTAEYIDADVVFKNLGLRGKD